MRTTKVRTTTPITLSIETDIIHDLKMRNENISALVRDLLRMHLKLTQSQERVEDDKLDGEIIKQREILRLLEIQKKENENKIQKEKDEYQRKIDTGEIRELKW